MDADVESLARGTVLVWGGATVSASSQVAPSPVIVEEVGRATTRVLTHAGETLELPNDRIESTYELASEKVSESAIERYWKDF